mmetsp:Transcript_53913/g.101051  ORF Transcript_53913/g.101051 Transcript_53913/m.101051 type:complete len:232 (+) Transcript_53913:357-1052(+)
MGRNPGHARVASCLKVQPRFLMPLASWMTSIVIRSTGRRRTLWQLHCLIWYSSSMQPQGARRSCSNCQLVPSQLFDGQRLEGTSALEYLLGRCRFGMLWFNGNCGTSGDILAGWVLSLGTRTCSAAVVQMPRSISMMSVCAITCWAEWLPMPTLFVALTTIAKACLLREVMTTWYVYGRHQRLKAHCTPFVSTRQRSKRFVGARGSVMSWPQAEARPTARFACGMHPAVDC